MVNDGLVILSQIVGTIIAALMDTSYSAGPAGLPGEPDTDAQSTGVMAASATRSAIGNF